MKSSVFYRAASILIFLFALGHTIGFRQSDPRWQADALLASMQSTRFLNGGFSRTYWDFFTGFGLFVSVLMFFAALLAWQLGSISPIALAQLRTVCWAFAVCFVVVTFLSWRYFFLTPLIFSAIISGVLITAAWLSPDPNK